MELVLVFCPEFNSCHLFNGPFDRAFLATLEVNLPKFVVSDTVSMLQMPRFPL